MIVRARSILALLAALFLAQPAAAQTFPARPVRFIVPLAAGGVADTICRRHAWQEQRER